ncbi:MAG: hypothetical protein ACREI3_04300, partial [Nitrospirales bacterium]
EQQAAAEERAGLEAALQRERTRLARLNREQADREAGLATILREAHTVEAEAQAVQARMTDVRLAVTTLQARREHDERDLARLRQEQQDREGRIQGLTRQREELEASARQSQVDLDRNMARFRELEQRAAQVRAELVTVQDTLTQALQQADELDRRLAEVRESRAATRTGRTQVEVRRAEIKTQLASLESTLTETYQLAVEQALTYEPDPEEGASGSPSEGEAGCQSQIVAQTVAQIAAPDAAALREELQKLRDRLQRMGPINLASIEEHQALEERYRFLVEQEKDLTNSISALKQIISRINRTTKQMFMETFAELQQKFSEVFVRLFPGGRAELLLVEPQQPDAQESAPVDGGPGGVEEGAQGSVREGGEDPGVDIVAQPPGKRLKSITMLSGGEKTLTAMALLFASFLIRPTPFCILDEIDAPLDEENIGRFTAVLRELAENAQFLVVTHNKRTMTVADSLFGVTMEEPGVSKLVSVRLAELQPV